MRVLLLSFYYPPDIGPGSLRAKSIVDSLIKEGSPDLKIDVITTMPNRYHSLNFSASKYEEVSKISIHRITIPKHKSSMFDQTKAFVLFSFAVRKLILREKVGYCSHNFFTFNDRKSWCVDCKTNKCKSLFRYS